MGKTSWLAVDERGDETFHQHEPVYNKLQKKWLSSSRVHIIRGLSKLILDNKCDGPCLAVAYEIDNVALVGNKAHVVNITKIY